jgi:hypothetical protein
VRIGVSGASIRRFRADMRRSPTRRRPDASRLPNDGVIDADERDLGEVPEETLRGGDGRRAGPEGTDEDLAGGDRGQGGGISTRCHEAVQQLVREGADPLGAGQVGEDDRCVEEHPAPWLDVLLQPHMRAPFGAHRQLSRSSRSAASASPYASASEPA